MELFIPFISKKIRKTSIIPSEQQCEERATTYKIRHKKQETTTCNPIFSTQLHLLQHGQVAFWSLNIKFRDVDISRDTAPRDMVRHSHQQVVPVIDIGGKIIVGFDRPKIDRILGLRLLCKPYQKI